MDILNSINIIFLTAIALWIAGTMLFILPFRQKVKNIGVISSLTGTLLMVAFLTLFWITVKQPAFRSVYETIIWYSIAITLLGFVGLLLWRNKWFLVVCSSIAIALLSYIIVNNTFPDTYSHPLFQSKWFVPHVLIYLLAYVILTGAFIFTIVSIYQSFRSDEMPEYLKKVDILVNIGFILITIGLILGAFWAKDIWGNYWSWDIKETTALLTWSLYLIYIHLRQYQPMKFKINLWVLIIAYFTLLFCWVGTLFLNAIDNSIHNFVN
jgi:ABC-type transport system involved in cytochrome c biogenesis permease subunit